MANICKTCKSELKMIGYHKEAPDYREWKCPKCDSKKKQSQLILAYFL